MTQKEKTDVVEVYANTSFKECVLYCTDEGFINPQKERQVMVAYNQNEHFQHEIVNDFFDYLGIDEELFLSISENI